MNSYEQGCQFCMNRIHGRQFLNSMDTDMVSSQGTAITEAIKMAETYYNDEDQVNKVLFIISDGEDHEGSISQIVNEAANLGIHIYTIGVGTKKGGPIPIKRNGILQYYKRDQNNQQVITRLDAEKLIEIATKGNGKYLDGSNTNEVVDQVTTILNGMNQKEFEAKQFTDFKDRFQWFLGLAIFLLVIEFLLLERKTAWIKEILSPCAVDVTGAAAKYNIGADWMINQLVNN